MSASAVYILDIKGKVLICRNYRGDIDMNIIDQFMVLYREREEENTVVPVMPYGNITFIFITYSDLFIVATTKKNGNVTMVLAFLHKMTLQPQIPTTLTTAVSWRPENIEYKKNEVFLDVVESVNLLVSGSGNVLRNEINGVVQMKVQLTGMPELRLGLNDKVLFENTGRGRSKSVEMEDVKFHQCVRLSRFEHDRTISFIPPDGEFELMSYRLQSHAKPLIWLESVVEKHAHSRVEYMIKAKSQFKKRSTANNVEIEIPVPADADSPKFKTTTGSCKWYPDKCSVIWTIKSFPGCKEHLCRAHFKLPSVEPEDDEGKAPIYVRFEIPYYTVSGLQVRYLKIIEKRGYSALPWVRYITQNGDYQLRVS